MNCRHWSDCKVRGGGCCALSLHGGRPSLGTCCRCEQRDPAGLGDAVAAVLEVTRIGPAARQIIDRLTGKPCGCDGRRRALNRIIPFQK